MSEHQHSCRHPDWNTPEGRELREQLERSKRVRAEWNVTARKDARVAAIVIGAFCAFLLLPIWMKWLHIPLPSWTYIPDWMWR